MRTFISIHLSQAIQDSIVQLQDELGRKSNGIRWIPIANCHLTLKFLGEIEEEVLPVIESALLPVAEEFDHFTMGISGVGTFPPKGPPSVVWVGVQKGERALRALEQRLGEALRVAEVSFDNKKFVPHITIGRARKDKRPFVPARDFRHTDIGTMTAHTFSLMESRLQPSGAVYTERISFSLGK